MLKSKTITTINFVFDETTKNQSRGFAAACADKQKIFDLVERQMKQHPEVDWFRGGREEVRSFPKSIVIFSTDVNFPMMLMSM